MHQAVPQVVNHRLAPRARETFCLTTAGVSRLLLVVHLLLFDMITVMFGLFIGLKYPDL